MSRIQKDLQKLSPKEQVWSKEIINKLITGKTQGLDIQKLKGGSDILRVRKGDLRIIYRIVNGEVILLRIARRSEKTYR